MVLLLQHFTARVSAPENEKPCSSTAEGIARLVDRGSAIFSIYGPDGKGRPKATPHPVNQLTGMQILCRQDYVNFVSTLVAPNQEDF